MKRYVYHDLVYLDTAYCLLKVVMPQTSKYHDSESPEPAPSSLIEKPTLPTQSDHMADDAEEDDIGPIPLTNGIKRKAKGDGDDGDGQENGIEGDEEDDDSGFEDEGDADTDRTPISHEIILKDHSKVRFVSTYQSRKHVNRVIGCICYSR